MLHKEEPLYTVIYYNNLNTKCVFNHKPVIGCPSISLANHTLKYYIMHGALVQHKGSIDVILHKDYVHLEFNKKDKLHSQVGALKYN